MNKLIPQFTVLLLAGWSINVWAFSCMDASGQTLHSMAGHGSVNVYVNLQPTIAVGQNLVVDISVQWCVGMMLLHIVMIML